MGKVLVLCNSDCKALSPLQLGRDQRKTSSTAWTLSHKLWKTRTYGTREGRLHTTQQSLHQRVDQYSYELFLYFTVPLTNTQTIAQSPRENLTVVQRNSFQQLCVWWVKLSVTHSFWKRPFSTEFSHNPATPETMRAWKNMVAVSPEPCLAGSFEI